MLLDGMNILVTGANRGIGLATLGAVARNGAANVWVCNRTCDEECSQAMREAVAGTSAKIVEVAMDLLEPKSIRAALSTIASSGLPLDGLVNNSGTAGKVGLFQMTRMEDVRDVFEVNFFGPMLLTQGASRLMARNKKGAIVFVSSVAALDGGPGQLEYVASKAALLGATRKLSGEFARSGIRVNAVAPGITKTRMGGLVSTELVDEHVRLSALGRVARPEEIADSIVFLLSSMSSHITGETIRIDGGRK